TELDQAVAIFDKIAEASAHGGEVGKIRDELKRVPSPLRRHVMSSIHRVLLATRDEDLPARGELIAWRDEQDERGQRRYGSHLYSESDQAALRVPEI
ncbi:MAG: hypothetical protein GWO02_11285, partial [Gammaproteobacteria bacterium]|nr:hypothetical protein [Gammaproteobacteria bacterium]